MKFYHYITTGHIQGWDTIHAIPFDLSVANTVCGDDIVLVHWNDWKPEQEQEDDRAQSLVEVIGMGRYKEIILFSGDPDDMDSDVRQKELIRCWIKNDKDPLDHVFRLSRIVGDRVDDVFDLDFAAYCSKEKNYACNWFDPQLGELKTAFRLLTQVWLVTMSQVGGHDSDGKLKKMLQESWDDLKDGFWKPVLDANGRLHAKLVGATRTGNEPDWSILDLEKLSPAAMRDWAFANIRK